MGMWGARPKGRHARNAQSNAVTAYRLEQLMTFVERAAAPPPEYVVPDLPPRIVSMARPVEATVERPEPDAVPEPVGDTTQSAPVAGKRRRVLPHSA